MRRAGDVQATYTRVMDTRNITTERNRNMTARLRFVGLAVLGATALLNATQAPPVPVPQQPTFKAQVEYVEVDALVSDASGNFVRGLTKDDFQVLEDGKAQTISTFTLVDIPIERYTKPLGAALPIEPDVRTNERPFDGRVYVMVIDDLHTSLDRKSVV